MHTHTHTHTHTCLLANYWSMLTVNITRKSTHAHTNTHAHTDLQVEMVSPHMDEWVETIRLNRDKVVSTTDSDGAIKGRLGLYVLKQFRLPKGGRMPGCCRALVRRGLADVRA